MHLNIVGPLLSKETSEPCMCDNVPFFVTLVAQPLPTSVFCLCLGNLSDGYLEISFYDKVTLRWEACLNLVVP